MLLFSNSIHVIERSTRMQLRGWKWKSADLCKPWALPHNAVPTSRKRAAARIAD
jgi:hypothetical protein